MVERDARCMLSKFENGLSSIVLKSILAGSIFFANSDGCNNLPAKGIDIVVCVCLVCGCFFLVMAKTATAKITAKGRRI